ncbi:Uncharacterized protein BP5553_05138 [Venustampulla echinocandica]|uniref:Major facilitator superfamily (MFS) profile domain-containing protein n=1 Tax=Venustampulla echinocandica TaxID=2656787 RepID=A0A370TQ99_9HELO|nr:Uncharacterized protein BP5553_05138 [Venustampulla echinocandica]RDL37705.1 Uncharacterized protein BP5553_05138 [Venustampulla echinocandica]
MSSPEAHESVNTTTGDQVDLEKANAGEVSHDGNAIKPDQGKPDAAKLQQSNLQTILILAAAFLGMFLVAVDRTIISTAIPRITDDFHSLSDVSWYGSVYLLTCCAFQLLFGKFYTFYPVRWVLLGTLLIFEVGSAICGAAPNSIAFILGRAVCGVGAAGIFAGTIVCVVHAVPLQKRPKVQGLMGAIMGFATVIGPLIGGGFTSNVSWRWCFYINLPFGGVAMAAIFFFLKLPDQETYKLPWAQKLSQLDAPGTAVLVPGIVCLLLALQWGRQIYAWNNGRVIVLLTVAGVLIVAFIFVQALLPKTATLPPRILKQRSVAASLWSTICIGSSQYIFIYYLPFWFQSIKGVVAVQSGIRLLPTMIAFVLASISGGFLNQKIGWYTPLGIFGASLMAVGAGLLTILQVDTAAGKWIGYQVLYGFGMGLCFQTPNLATQTSLPKRDVPMGMALMFFGQLLGAAVFVSAGQNVLDNQLLQRLAGIPGFDRSLVTAGGATTLVGAVRAEYLGQVLTAYNESLRKVFQIGLILSCLAVLGVSSMEWKNILKKPEAPPAANDGAANAPAEKTEATEKK